MAGQSFFSPRSDNPLIRWWWSIDRLAFGIIMILAGFGVMSVISASPSVASRIGSSDLKFILKHLVFLLPCLMAIFVISWVKVKTIKYGAIALYGAAALGMVLTLVYGMEIKGATRWISVFGFTVQPSEFMKPGFLVLSAWLLSDKDKYDNIPRLFLALLLYGVSAILYLSQPDFGMFFLLSVAFGAQIFMAGCSLRTLVALLGAGVVLIIMAYITLGHARARIDGFLFPDAQDTYQIDLSKEAFANGGFLGTGLGQGTVKNRVPDVHADFIFTAIGEEWGFLFGVCFLSAMFFLYYRFFSRFLQSDSPFVLLAGGGLTFMLVGQSFIHIGSAIQLLPAKGMTLPLISYGGSSLVSVGVTYGILLALSRGLYKKARPSSWRHLTRKDF